MNPKLISQGAEAKIYLETRTEKPKVIKDRISKSYRHPQLDTQIRRKRTKAEAKILTKAKEAEINIPDVIHIDKPNHKLTIEFIEGERLSETLNDKQEKEKLKIMKLLGEQVAKLHTNNIIHGDLTTSNTILANPFQKNETSSNPEASNLPAAGGDTNASEKRAKDIRNEVSRISQQKEKVFLIDFGLGFISKKIEDKAVDLHLIKQALEAKHFQNHEELFNNFLKGYKKGNSEYTTIKEQLKKVEARGRYKH